MFISNTDVRAFVLQRTLLWQKFAHDCYSNLTISVPSHVRASTRHTLHSDKAEATKNPIHHKQAHTQVRYEVYLLNKTKNYSKCVGLFVRTRLKCSKKTCKQSDTLGAIVLRERERMREIV